MESQQCLVYFLYFMITEFRDKENKSKHFWCVSAHTRMCVCPSMADEPGSNPALV